MKLEHITVQHVNTEKLIEHLNIELKENESLVVEKFAVWSDKYGIDTDCCFWEIVDKYIDTNVVKCIELECRIKKYDGNGGYRLRMDKADFVKTITLNEYLELSEDVQLVDFIRLDYNPRISTNQRLLMKHINAIHKLEPTE